MKTKIKIVIIAMMGINLGINAQKVISLEGANDPNFVNKEGKVGIGTVNPTYKVEWYNNNHKGFLDFTYTGVAIGSKNGDFSIYSNATRRFFIDTKGYVGIGTTNPEAGLHITNHYKSIIADGLFYLKNDKAPTDKKNWYFAAGDKGNLSLSTARDNYNWKKTILNIKDNGYIGVGTSSPEAGLHITNHYRSIIADGLFYLKNDKAPTDKKNWYFAAGDNGDFYLNTAKDNYNWRKKILSIKENGNAALYGKLESKEIKVTNTPTADFVFEENYNLPTLESIEKHIEEKKHLPEIASAKEMEKNGVNIGNFQIQLLQKIEELTLYTISQEKEISELKKEKSKNEKQQKEIDELKALVQKLLKDKN